MDYTLEKALQQVFRSGPFNLKPADVLKKYVLFLLALPNRPVLRWTMDQMTEELFRAHMEIVKENINQALNKKRRLVVNLRIEPLSEKPGPDSKEHGMEDDGDGEEIYF